MLDAKLTNHRASPCDRRTLDAGSLSAASLAQHLDSVLARLERASREVGRQILCTVRCRQTDDGANPTQQSVGGEPELEAAQLLQAASSSGQPVLGFTTLLPEQSLLHAQPMPGAARQSPRGTDDWPRPSALTDAAGPGTASAPTSLTRIGCRLLINHLLPEFGFCEPAYARLCNARMADSNHAVIGPAAERPAELPVGLTDRMLVDAGDAPLHQSRRVELPVLVA